MFVALPTEEQTKEIGGTWQLAEQQLKKWQEWQERVARGEDVDQKEAVRKIHIKKEGNGRGCTQVRRTNQAASSSSH